jgi:hypothetical protein
LRGNVAALTPNLQPGVPRFSFVVVSFSRKVPVLRRQELAVVVSRLLHKMMLCLGGTTCATSRKVAGSIPDGVFGIFH